MFSVQLVTADSYMSKPQPALDVSYSQFRGSEVNHVPVIRIFGSTVSGEKACLHIHGVFPYLCVAWKGADPVESLVYRLASALDKALNTSLGSSNATTQHVYSVTPMSAIPMYGYHNTEQQFLKIHLYNPAMVKRSAELLQSGEVLGRVLQPHESHLPFILQFMIDYNLQGMSPVILECARFRRPAPAGMADNLGEDVLLPVCVQRMSSCAVEADVLASGIVNPRTLLEGEAYPGLQAMWEEERQRRVGEELASSLHSVAHSSQQRPEFTPGTPELRFRQGLLQRLATLRTQEEGTQLQCRDEYASCDNEEESPCSISQMDSQDQGLLCDLVRLQECCDVEDPHSPQHRGLECDDEELWDDSYWDQFAGRIPQLDGAEDDEDCTHSPVICSGKFGRSGASIRGRENCQLTGENVIDGTCWPEYRGLLDGLSNQDVTLQRPTSPGGSILGDDADFPYGLDLDFDGLEVCPNSSTPTSTLYESASVDVPRPNLTNYSLADMSQDYSSPLINDVFLSAITDDATQCYDIQSLHGVDFLSDVGCLTGASGSESVLDSEDTLVEETLHRVQIPSKTLPGMVRHVGSLRTCEDRSRILSTYAGMETAAPAKQFDSGPGTTSNIFMLTHNDGSVNILNTAMGSSIQFPKNMCVDNKYVRVLSLSDYRGHSALGGESDTIKGKCMEVSGSLFGADSFSPARRVVGVDRTTETSPSLLRCSDSALPENTHSYGNTSSSSAHRDKSKNIVKFFLKSSLLREKPTHSVTEHDFLPQHLKESVNRGNAYHSALVTKSNLEKSSKLFRCTEKSPPGKLRTLSEAFTKKGRGVLPSTVQGEGFSRYGVLNSSSRYYERFGRDGSKSHVANFQEDSFLHRKEPNYHKNFDRDLLGGRHSGDLHLQVSPTSSEEDKSLVKVERSPRCSSRASSEDQRRCTCYVTSNQTQHQCHTSTNKGDYDPYEFSDEMEELLSCGSPPSWPRRSSHSMAKSTLPGPPRGGKPASYLQQGAAAHRVSFRMTCGPTASPRCRESKVTDMAANQPAECSKYTEALQYSSETSNTCTSQSVKESTMDNVLENIKTEPVWEEEITSIPKLTLLRDGDTYINFVRLDEDDRCSAPKLEVVDKPIELAVVKDKPIELTVVKDKPIELAVVKDKPIELAVVKDKPIELAVVKDRPIELAVVKDKPLELAVVKDKPIELAVVKDKPIELAVVKDKPFELAVLKDKPFELVVVKDKPIELAVGKDKPIELAVVKDKSIQLAVVKDKTIEVAIVKDEKEQDAMEGSSSQYCRAMDDYSADGSDCVETKNVVLKTVDSPLESPRHDYKLVDCFGDDTNDGQLFVAESTPAIEVIDLSPSSDSGASIEVLETCWTKNPVELRNGPASDEAGEVAAVVMAQMLDDVADRVTSPSATPPCHATGVEPLVSSCKRDRGVVCGESESTNSDAASMPPPPANLSRCDEHVSKVRHKGRTLVGRKVRRSAKVSKLKVARERNGIFLLKKMSSREMASERYRVGSYVKRRRVLNNPQDKEFEYRNVYISSRCVVQGLKRRRKKYLSGTTSRVEVSTLQLCEYPAKEGDARTSLLAQNAVHQAVGNNNRELLCNVANFVSLPTQQLHNTTGVCDGTIASNISEAVECFSVSEELVDGICLECPQVDGVELSCSSSVVSTENLETDTVKVCASGGDGVSFSGVEGASIHTPPAKSLRKVRQKTEKFEVTVKVNDTTDPIAVTLSIDKSSSSPDALPHALSTTAWPTDDCVVPSLAVELLTKVANDNEPSSTGLFPVTTKQRPTRTSRTRAKGRECVRPVSMAEASNKEESVHVVCSERARKCTPPLQHSEVTRKHGCKMLSVSLSKALPKCRKDSNITKDFSLNENNSLKKFSSKLPQTFSKPKNIKKASFSTKTGWSATTDNSKLNLPRSVPLKTGKQLDDARNKESECKTGRKVNGSLGKVGKVRKVRTCKNDVKCVGEGEVKGVCSKPKRNASSRSVKTKGRDVSVSCRTGRECSSASSKANTRKQRKRSCSSTLSRSRSGKQTKLKGRYEAECLVRTENENSSCAMELNVANKPQPGTARRRVSRKRVETGADVKHVFNLPDTCGGIVTQVCTRESSLPVSTHMLKNMEESVTIHNSSASRDVVHKTSDDRFGKCNNKLLQCGKGKTAKVGGRKTRKKASQDLFSSRTLRSGKVVSKCGGSLETTQEVALMVPGRCGRPRKICVGGEQGKGRHSEPVAAIEPSTGKSSKVSKRDLGYVKQLRSYAHKQTCKRGPEVTSSRSVQVCRRHRKVKIPCVDGASGSSSSEDESAVIYSSQPTSPEHPPLKRLKSARCAGHQQFPYSRRAPTSPARKARLPVQIVRSPRRLLQEGHASTSPDLVPDTPPGQCLASMDVTRGFPGSSHNLALEDGAAVMGNVKTAQRLLVPSRTVSEERPKIVQFNDKVFLFPSACDNFQDKDGETGGAMNHRCVRKKLKFSVGDQQQQHSPHGDQQIKILCRSSVDIFTDSSSLSCDPNNHVKDTFDIGDCGVCDTRSRMETKETLEYTSCTLPVSVSVENEPSWQKLEDKEGDEGIVSFYETTLPSPPELGCSYDSPVSSGALPASPPQARPLAEPFYGDPRDVTAPVRVGSRLVYLRAGPNEERREALEVAVASPEPVSECAGMRFLVPASPGHDGSEEELLLSPDSLGSSTSPALIVHSTPLPVAPLTSMEKYPTSEVSTQCKKKAWKSGQFHQRLASSPIAGSLCQVAGVTPDNSHDFLLSLHNLQDAHPVTHPHTHMLTLLSLELHVNTRGDLRPDPLLDPIQAVFYSLYQDEPLQPPHQSGVLVVDATPGHSTLSGAGVDCKVECVGDELALLAAVERLVASWDPDILAGYEVEMLSWGYLFQRSSALGLNLCPRVSRIPGSTRDSHVASSEDEVRRDTRVAGRILFDVWRLMRHQVVLQSYTYESVVYQVLHQRRPQHTFRTLTSWWSRPGFPTHRWIVVEYYLERARGTVRLLEQLDVLGTTSELARLFGIQFQEVLTRGSQFRVESMMLRLARLNNYMAVSPSVKQRATMRAPEFLQLIMEPESRFYSDPVVVLDFQSLYPSIMIAYNYCYSTCLGRVEVLPQAGSFKFGCSELHVPRDVLETVLEDISISPCGVGFVGVATRMGVLPRMLQHILRTRLMVKQVMKDHPDDKLLLRVLHARQLGLKLIANVTYGYTAANFSGRMPCVEVADSVVSKGRETLERAIQLVETNQRWNAHVVYGDTDSMFVMLAGRTREQAFAIGAEIAEAVTLDNPSPVKLKLEKVYQPCILQTKKRYVGYAYESPRQEQPKYDAKGIETVRRDGCPAVAKVLEKSLRVLFDSRDVSLVKRYVCRQWDKIVQGRANIQDLVFAKEYRGRAGYKPGAYVPALHLARRWLEMDPRAEPRVGERVPYVVVNGPPSVPLISLVRSPHDLLIDTSLRINAVYYITRCIIPALRRCFSLLGADVDAWYTEMPRKVAPSLPLACLKPSKRTTISQYFGTVKCVVCEERTHDGLCSECLQQPSKVAAVLADKLLIWERTHANIMQVCRSCCGRYEPINCCSIDCPVLFRRSQAQRDLLQETYVRDLLSQHLSNHW